MNYAESKYLTVAATLLAAGLLVTPASAQDAETNDKSAAATAEKLAAIEPAAGPAKVQINAKSESDFRLSLKAMKASLQPEERKRLTQTLMELAYEGKQQDSATMMSDKTAVQIVYEKMGPQLHGKTFEDIVKLPS